MIGGLLLLGVLGTFMLKGAARGSFADRLSTYRSEPDGARALFLLSEQWHLPVSRLQESLETIDPKQNLVLLGVDMSELSEKEEEERFSKPFSVAKDGGFDLPQKSEAEEDDDKHRSIHATFVRASEREKR